MKNKNKNSEKLNHFWKTILENWPAKVICILLAVLLYMICKISTLDKKTFAVPLQVNSNGSLLVVNSLPRTIRVTARGDKNEVGLLQDKDFKVFIDTSSFTEIGTYKVPVQILLSDNATVIEPLEVTLSPENIMVELDYIATDLKPVKLNTTGTCAKGYEVTSVKIVPEKVQISGNSRQVNSIKEIETDVISLDGKKDSFVQTVGLLNHNRFINISGNKEFTATVTIAQIFEERKISIENAVLSNLSSKLTCENENLSVKIIVSGFQNDIDAFESTKGKYFTLDCSKIKNPGEYTLPVEISVPENITIKSIESAEVLIKLSDVKNKEPEVKVEETSLVEGNGENNEHKSE